MCSDYKLQTNPQVSLQFVIATLAKHVGCRLVNVHTVEPVLNSSLQEVSGQSHAPTTSGEEAPIPVA